MDIIYNKNIVSISQNSFLYEKCLNALNESSREENVIKFGNSLDPLCREMLQYRENELSQSVEYLNQAIQSSPSTVMQKVIEFKGLSKESVLQGTTSSSNEICDGRKVEDALKIISSALFVNVQDYFMRDIIQRLETYAKNGISDKVFDEKFVSDDTPDDKSKMSKMDLQNETQPAKPIYGPNLKLLRREISFAVGPDECTATVKCEEIYGSETASPYFSELDLSLELEQDIDESIFENFDLGISEELKLIDKALCDIESIQGGLEQTLSLLKHLTVNYDLESFYEQTPGMSLVESKHFTSNTSISTLDPYSDLEFSPIHWKYGASLTSSSIVDVNAYGHGPGLDFLNRHSMMKIKRIKVMYECQSALVQLNHAVCISKYRAERAQQYIVKTLRICTPRKIASPGRIFYSPLMTQRIPKNSSTPKGTQ